MAQQELMKVLVQTDQGLLLLDISVADNVLKIKTQIEQKLQIPPSQQCLQLRGNILENNEIITNIGLQPSDIFRCIDLGPRSIVPSIVNSEFTPQVFNICITFTEPDGNILLATILQSSRDLVYHAKTRIKSIFSIEVKFQVLQVGPVQFENGRRLSFYREQLFPADDGLAHVTLLNIGPPRSSLYAQLMVRTLIGKTITLNEVDLRSKVFVLKKLIEEKDGILVASQRIIFQGKQLEDDKSLVDYRIRDGSTLHLTLRLLGGT